MNSISQAVKIAIARGKIDGQWMDAELLGDKNYSAHLSNENFALCSGNDARADFYAMWTPIKFPQHSIKARSKVSA